jgi:hypothetical protein
VKESALFSRGDERADAALRLFPRLSEGTRHDGARCDAELGEPLSESHVRRSAIPEAASPPEEWRSRKDKRDSSISFPKSDAASGLPNPPTEFGSVHSDSV